MQRLTLCFLTILVLFSCGSKVTDEQKNAALRDQLNMDKQEECNAQKKFYNNQEAGTACSSVHSLAQWQCTRQGIGNRWAETKSEANRLERLDERLAAGFAIHQCGENLKEAIVVLVKQNKAETSVSSEIEVLTLSYPSAMLNVEIDSTKSLKSGVCIEIPVRYFNYMGGGYSPAPLDVPGEILWEAGNVKYNNASGNESKPASLAFYTDAQCQGEGTSVLKIVMPKGKDALTVYGKPQGNRDSLIVYAKGNDQTISPKKPSLEVTE